jgi:hypothetical protein
MYPGSLQSPYGRGHTRCCFPPQHGSEWLDGNLYPHLQSQALEPLKRLFSIFIHISRVKLWNPSKVSNSDEAQYSCEPLEDLQLLFRKAPQDK